jgi:ubiquitin carboxyl-terminal hydrolase 10
MANLTSVEVLDGVTGANGEPICITKQNLLEKLPPILVLHLKRFHYDPEYGIRKLCHRVAYGAHFSFDKNMVAAALRNKPLDYTLIGGKFF